MDVPRELAERKQWVLWRNEDGRKIPYQPSGQYAKSNDPSTWSTLEECKQQVGGYTGIGYVFSADDPFCGIDLDGAFEVTGDPSPWAAEILDKCPSYAEISPSGNGVKLWVRGKLADGRGRKYVISDTEQVEIYDRGRYFTFTGQVLDEFHGVIVDCQAEIDRLVEKFWPAKAIAHKPTTSAAGDVVARAIAYTCRIPPSHSGQDRGTKTLQVATALVRGFNLSRDQAFPILWNWNSGCSPNDWPEEKLARELRRKLNDADQYPGERGWLLNSRREDFSDVDLSKFMTGPAAMPDGPTEEEQAEAEVPLANFPTQCLETMPSVMREAFDYVVGTAIKPQPELTLGALIALFGAAFGRKVTDDYNTRTNVMILGLAPSGSGKEHPRQCNKEFLIGAGMEMVNAPERIGSSAGIISVVAQHPVRLFQLDEIGRMLATMRDPKVSHLYNVGTVLMQMYSSSNTLWTGDAYADLSKIKQIDQPHVCVFGTSVSKSLYEGLSPENLTDGLVGRLLVFQSSGTPARRKPVRTGLPWRVTETLKYWSEYALKGSGNFGGGELIFASKTPEADARHESYCDAVDGKNRTEDEICSAVWARAPEKAAKLALIYACCEATGDQPVITLDAVNWGISLANYSTRLVLQAARNAISGSRYESDLKFVFQAIGDEISHWQLTRKIQRLKQRDRTEILADLQGSGAIETVLIDTGKRPRTIYRRKRQTL